MNTRIFIVLLLIIALAFNAAAQSSGGTFAITKSVIAAGGSQSSSGGSFALAGTIGQAAAGDSLTGGGFSLNSGFWSPTIYNVGNEADIASRPGGNGAVESDDVILIRRLVNGTLKPDPEYNEFQRADSAPRASFGDGLLDSTDIIQARRYQNNTVAPHVAAGPFEPNAAPRFLPDEDERKSGEKLAASNDDYSSEPQGGAARARRIGERDCRTNRDN